MDFNNHNTTGIKQFGNILVQTSEMCGKRKDMEDVSFCEEISIPAVISDSMSKTRSASELDSLRAITKDIVVAIYGVCDGHAGSEISRYVAENIKGHIAKAFKGCAINENKSVQRCTNAAFGALQVEIEEKFVASDAGTTCAMVLNIPELSQFYAINCGDSRVYGLVCEANDRLVCDSPQEQYKKIKVEQLTTDHTPSDPIEAARIKSVGGIIGAWMGRGVLRLNYQLSVTRSFGDMEFRSSGLIENPDVFGPFKLDKDQGFIGFLISCDGVSETLNVGNMSNHINEAIAKDDGSKYLIADLIRCSAFDRGSNDNISTISGWLK